MVFIFVFCFCVISHLIVCVSCNHGTEAHDLYVSSKIGCYVSSKLVVGDDNNGHSNAVRM